MICCINCYLLTCLPVSASSCYSIWQRWTEEKVSHADDGRTSILCTCRILTACCYSVARETDTFQVISAKQLMFLPSFVCLFAFSLPWWLQKLCWVFVKLLWRAGPWVGLNPHWHVWACVQHCGLICLKLYPYVGFKDLSVHSTFIFISAPVDSMELYRNSNHLGPLCGSTWWDYQHLWLRTRRFCWSRVLLPTCPWWQVALQIID